jgi:hypothetical protein
MAMDRRKYVSRRPPSTKLSSLIVRYSRQIETRRQRRQGHRMHADARQCNFSAPLRASRSYLTGGGSTPSSDCPAAIAAAFFDDDFPFANALTGSRTGQNLDFVPP